MAWWLDATGGYGVKLVNPGGVELLEAVDGGDVDSLDDEVAGFEVTPRQVLEAIGGAVDELGLPHPVHVHANNLGVPGNADDDARHDAHAVGPPGALRPPPVPLLRRQAAADCASLPRARAARTPAPAIRSSRRTSAR